MNIKKIAIACVCGFVAMTVASIVPMILFYAPHGEAQAEKFLGVVQTTPEPLPAMIGAISNTL